MWWSGVGGLESDGTGVEVEAHGVRVYAFGLVVAFAQAEARESVVGVEGECRRVVDAHFKEDAFGVIGVGLVDDLSEECLADAVVLVLWRHPYGHDLGVVAVEPSAGVSAYGGNAGGGCGVDVGPVGACRRVEFLTDGVGAPCAGAEELGFELADLRDGLVLVEGGEVDDHAASLVAGAWLRTCLSGLGTLTSGRRR